VVPRRGAAVAALTLAALFIFAPAVVVAQSTKFDRAFGSGVRQPLRVGSPAPSFAFNAQSGPDGQDPGGIFTVQVGSGNTFTASLTCLRVNGDTANLVGLVTYGAGVFDPAGPSYGGTEYFAVQVTDNGKPVKKAPSTDTMSVVITFAPPDLTAAGKTLADVCTDPLGFIGTSTAYGLVSGDLTVVDR
jgi:hypothetical protein